jgi:hypothetical protein
MTKDQVFRTFDLEEVNPAAYAAGWAALPVPAHREGNAHRSRLGQ